MQKAVFYLGVAAILVLTSSISAQFYYGSNGPVPLSIDSNKVLIKFDMTYNPESQSAILSQIDSPVSQDPCGPDTFIRRNRHPSPWLQYYPNPWHTALVLHTARRKNKYNPPVVRPIRAVPDYNGYIQCGVSCHYHF